MSKEHFIAVIDDDDPFRAALIELLGWRFDARGFKSADEFLLNDNAAMYDCIITDIQMPGMNGIELLQHLRSRNLHIPAVLVTAHIDLASEFDVEAVGATCILMKPFELETLTACLERALNAGADDRDQPSDP